MTLQKQPKIINETFTGFCISPTLGTHSYPFAQIHIIQTPALHQAQILLQWQILNCTKKSKKGRIKVSLHRNFSSFFLKRQKKQSSKPEIYTHFSKLCENNPSQRMELALYKYSVFCISSAHPKGLEIMHISKLKAACFHKLQTKLLQSPSINITQV